MLTTDTLDQFSGSEEIFKHWLGRLHFTEGVKYLAEEAGAYWLLDAIASYQPKLAADPMLADFQLWELHVKDGRCTLTCKADCDVPPAVQQEIEYTDFPLEYIKLYVENDCIMLPSER